MTDPKLTGEVETWTAEPGEFSAEQVQQVSPGSWPSKPRVTVSYVGGDDEDLELEVSVESASLRYDEMVERAKNAMHGLLRQGVPGLAPEE